jgi:subtilisin family serine protease
LRQRPNRAGGSGPDILSRDGASRRRAIRHLAAEGATVPADARDTVLARLRAEPAVAFAEVDGPIGAPRPRFGPRLQSARAAVSPNDDGFDQQQALRNSDDHDVDATNAWEHRTQCATVAIVDSGIKTDHNDLRDNIWVNGDEIKGNGLDDDRNGYVDDYKGVDLIDARGSGVDQYGHGTHVAGIVAARGNNGRGVTGLCWKATSTPFYPAAYPDANVISVAASDEKDRLASFSNYGATSVDLAAPGEDIASTWDDGGYRGASGTSMATSLVSAAAAMLRKAGVDSPGRIRELLMRYADDKSKLKGKVASGGRLNINRALDSV